jgi:hypothetical protein
VAPRRTLIALGLALAWACSDDDETAPPGVQDPNGGSAGDSGGNSGRSGAAGSNRGGASSGESGSGGGGGGEAGTPGGEGGSGAGARGGTDAGGGTGGTSGTAGTGGSAGYPECPSDGEAGGPPTLNSLCDIEASWGAGVDLPLLPDGAAQLLAITPDELTIAWFGVENMETTFHVAERPSTSVSFEPGQELEPLDYVAMSPDGLRLALTEDGRLQERVRTAKDQPFGSPVEGSFATLDENAEQNDLMLLAGVISPDDRTLFYLVSDGTDDQPLRVSTRSGTGNWPVGTPIEACEFQTEAGIYRQPTGVSADGLTLFFVDYVRGKTRAAFRESTSDPFEWFVDLGTLDRAQPNADCSRLYFTATSGPSYADALP